MGAFFHSFLKWARHIQLLVHTDDQNLFQFLYIDRFLRPLDNSFINALALTGVRVCCHNNLLTKYSYPHDSYATHEFKGEIHSGPSPNHSRHSAIHSRHSLSTYPKDRKKKRTDSFS